MDAAPYRGLWLRLTVSLRSEGVEEWAGAWMRLDDAERQSVGFDNSRERAIFGDAPWSRQAIVLDVPESAERVVYGLLIDGPGQLWAGDFALEVVGEDVPTTAAPEGWGKRLLVLYRLLFGGP